MRCCSVRSLVVLALAVALAPACGDDDVPGADAAPGTPDAGGSEPDAVPIDQRPAPSQDWNRDILATDLTIDVAAMRGTARIELAGSTSTGASFEIGDLTITAVRDSSGPLRFETAGARLDIGIEAGDTPVTFTVEYAFATQASFDGYLTGGVSFLWPYHCGNLFPCHSTPADGLRFTLDVTGTGDDVAVYPQTIPGDAPSYMIAFAVGDYTYRELGTTAAGTEVGVWYLPGGETDALAGTTSLATQFDWLEQTYGAYTFGDRVAAVEADWGPGDFGGMEHHPLWHVASDSMDDAVTQAHEAAHGWFGNGIRIQCWEDFVLSEGVSSYLAARAIEASDGTAAGDAVWDDYTASLNYAVTVGDTIALPATCNEIDILNHPLWSTIPYMKGAFFMRAIEDAVGRDELDAALAGFYAQYAGAAATMQDLLDHIHTTTGFDPEPLATEWLRTPGVP